MFSVKLDSACVLRNRLTQLGPINRANYSLRTQRTEVKSILRKVILNKHRALKLSKESIILLIYHSLRTHLIYLEKLKNRLMR
jgi:hypothetical protein